MNPSLNQDQQDAVDALFAFLMNTEEREFRIVGPAGVGKTFLLQYLIDSLLKQYQDMCHGLGIKPLIQNVALTATTNRAADVLSGAMSKPTSTIHSFMNLKVEDDYSTGKQRLRKTPAFVVHSNYLIIIDEASMIDKGLYKILHEGTDSTCKFIYVGDDRQLAPVGEKLSPTMETSIPGAELTIPMRNSGQPALMALCNQLRQTVDTGVFTPIQAVPGVIEYLDHADFQREVDTNFTTENHDLRILAYTNEQVKAYNGYTRGLRGHGERLSIGEQVINNSGFEVRGIGTIPAEKEMIVSSVEPGTEILHFGDWDIEAYAIRLSFKHNPSISARVHQPLDRQRVLMASRSFVKSKEWFSYFKLKNSFPDLRARDASTVHKSQGSTFDAVYIDLANIGTCTMSDQTARMLYVAASRAKHRVYLYQDLPARYFRK